MSRTTKNHFSLLWALILVTGCRPYIPEPYVEPTVLHWGNIYIKSLADSYARKTWGTVTEAETDTILFRVRDPQLFITDEPSWDSLVYHELINREVTKTAMKEIFKGKFDRRKFWDYIWFNFLVSTKTPQGGDTTILFKNYLGTSFFWR